MRIFRFPLPVALCVLLALVSQAHLIPLDAISASVTYHLPIAYRNGDKVNVSDDTLLSWETRQRSVTLTINNTLDNDINITGAEVTFTDSNGVPAPQLQTLRRVGIPIAFKVSAHGGHAVEIDPQQFYYRLTAGQAYFARIVWQVDFDGGLGSYTQCFPYLTPDPTPMFSSEWVMSDGISARLLLQQTEKKGLQLMAEFRNDTAETIDFTLADFITGEVKTTGMKQPEMRAYKDVEKRTDIPLSLPPLGTATVVINNASSYGNLNLSEFSYSLAAGEYFLTATVRAHNPKAPEREWKFPQLSFIVPEHKPIPVFEPVEFTVVR